MRRIAAILLGSGITLVGLYAILQAGNITNLLVFAAVIGIGLGLLAFGFGFIFRDDEPTMADSGTQS